MKNSFDDVCCLILASGASERFGSSKMLHSLADGVCILAKTIRLYSKIFNTVYVVARHSDHKVAKLVAREGAVCIPNRNFAQGISQSIVTGVKSTSPNKAWIIALGDMPYISPSTIENIALRVAMDTIVVPRTPFGHGNPVGFGRQFEVPLLELKGDVGAKPVIANNKDSLRFYECNDAGVHHDIDRVSDILLTS